MLSKVFRSLLLASVLSSSVLAHGGHDHGDTPAATGKSPSAVASTPVASVAPTATPATSGGHSHGAPSAGTPHSHGAPTTQPISTTPKKPGNGTTGATQDVPRRYGMLLFEGFQALDVFGPLDALNVLSWQTQLNLSLISKSMDPVSDGHNMPHAKALGSNFEQKVLPTHTFANAPKDLEVLIVPGGLGTRAPIEELQPYITFIKDSFPKLRYLLTVCTGAGMAARAGVMDGRRATTNKKAWNATVALGPKVKWEVKARWVDDGKLWSSSGVSAGTDMTLAFIEKIYSNSTYNPAAVLATGMEWTRVTDAANDPFACIHKLTTDCPASGTPTGSKPATPATSPTPAVPAVSKPAATDSAATPATPAGGACTGSIVCNSETTWSMCSNGKAVPMGSVATGTKCVDGAITRR